MPLSTVQMAMELHGKIPWNTLGTAKRQELDTALKELIDSAQDDHNLLVCERRRNDPVVRVAIDSDGRHPAEIPESNPYTELADVLERAFDQASGGKGKERHVKAEGQRFEDQPICSLQRIYGEGYAFGQASKKMEEAMRLPKDRAVAELLGAINYIAAAIIVKEESDHGEGKEEA